MNTKIVAVIILVEIGFDNSENHNPYSERIVRIFVGADENKASVLAAEFIKDHLKNDKYYMGWDGSVYPKYELRNKYADLYVEEAEPINEEIL